MTLTAKQKSYRYGLWAEFLACIFLILKGYRILKRRYKTKVGEIDIIAVKNKSLIFIEVKARQDIGEALSSVTPYARKRIEKTAQYFMSRHLKYGAYDMRFDVIGISFPFLCIHLDNAWRPAS